MKKITSLILLLSLACTLAKAAEPYKRNPNPPTDGRLGSNYTPAYASNPIQFWHDFRADVVEKELKAAKKHFGYSMLRVYINTTNYFEEKKKLFKNLEKFLQIADKVGIKPGFVFFSGDHRAHGAVHLDGPFEPREGHHNGRWPSCPQEHEWDKDNPDDFSKFKPYIEDIVKKYREDERILFWEIHNEPPEHDERRKKLKTEAYHWAKALKPIHPVINCEKNGLWGDSEVSDIVDGHVYIASWGFFESIMKQNPGKGAVFTEAGARWWAVARNHGEPTDVVDWLERRKKAGKSQPGVFLCWELMVGNSNCRFHWRDGGYRHGKPNVEPEIPWCGMLWPNNDPVSLSDSHACLMYSTGKSPALFYDNFQYGYKKWKLYGTKWTRCKHAITLKHGEKAVAGDTSWKDYIVESRILLKRHWKVKGEKPQDLSGVEGTPSAGILFRVNEPGDEYADLRAYVASFDKENRLVLGKFNKGSYKELAVFDTNKLPVRKNHKQWNRIMVECKGKEIKVYFNRYHSDPDKGLRITYKDKDDPILSGSIGCINYGGLSLYDSITVMPVE